MRRMLPLLVLLCLALAPAPFPKRGRAVPQTMVGVWDVEWGGMPVRLDLRPDGSAHFEYTKLQGGARDGSWNYDDSVRQVTLTLLIDRTPYDYVMAFSAVGRDAAEGRVQGTPPSAPPLKLARSSRK